MGKWIDYYKILQVHSQAEHEVIESAYKRLCRKYHPDLNKSQSATEKIVQLNLAYEVLRDIDKRREFHQNWMIRNHGINGAGNGDAKKPNFNQLSVLEDYFHCISQEDYKKAYEFLSEYDKLRISKTDFCRWQQAVSKVFRIIRFECDSLKSFKNVTIGDCTFIEVIECCVKLTEKNLKNMTTMKDEVTKYLVNEEGQWSVFAGFQHLQPLIDKFESMAESKIFPSAMEFWASMQIRTDHVTGLPNREGFLDKANAEISRSLRYGNPLSVVFLKLKTNERVEGISQLDFVETMQRLYSRVLQKKIRGTDILGVWESGEFVVLLPETGYPSAINVARKLGGCTVHEEVPMSFRTEIYTGVVQYEVGPLNRSITEARLKAFLAGKLKVI